MIFALKASRACRRGKGADGESTIVHFSVNPPSTMNPEEYKCAVDVTPKEQLAREGGNGCHIEPD